MVALANCDSPGDSSRSREQTGGRANPQGGMTASGPVNGNANPGPGGSSASHAGAGHAGSADGGTSEPGLATGGFINSQGGSANAGASAGGASTDSAGSSPAGVAGSTGAIGRFVLAWQDDFDSLDRAAWELVDFTYDGNEAQFTPENASVANSVLTMKLTAAPNGSVKPYRGVEMRSRKTLTYGKVSARMRFAAGSGVVSGLVTFYTPFPNCDWNEIDIEHLGKSSNSSQLNGMVFLGEVDPNCAASVSPTQDPAIVELGFNAETDFHSYDIEWTPASVKYYADGQLLRTWTQHSALLRRPQNILLTVWASSAAGWAGMLDANSAPTSSQVDWIKVYEWSE